MSWPSNLAWVCLLAVAATGCRRCGDETSAPRRPVELRVDAPELDYVYRAPGGRLRSAPSVADIPSTLRGAVMVHHPTTTGSRPGSDRVYVADLLGADPGDTVTARPSTREAYARRTADLREARRYAELVRIAAIELTQMRPGSDRRAATEAARETFDEILPRLRDPDAGGEAAPDAGRPSETTPDATADTRSPSPRTVP